MRGKFRGHDTLYGKAMPRFPASAEREYIRLVNAYFRGIKAVLEEELPTLKEEYQKKYEDYKAVHMDGLFDFDAFINSFFAKIQKRLDDMEIFGKWIKDLRKIGMITKKSEIAEWKRMVKKTLNVDLSEDYYSGDFFDDLMEQWVSDNVDLIKTVPNDMLGRMKQIVSDGYRNGTRPKDMAEKIQGVYGMSRGHAQFIARDQISKLNAKITQREHADAGVTEYVWSSSGDERVRESHKRLNGHIFKYSDPPETDNGRHCNPGEDYNCRCVAIPVFKEDTMSLALRDDEETTT